MLQICEPVSAFNVFIGRFADLHGSANHDSRTFYQIACKLHGGALFGKGILSLGRSIPGGTLDLSVDLRTYLTEEGKTHRQRNCKAANMVRQLNWEDELRLEDRLNPKASTYAARGVWRPVEKLGPGLEAYFKAETSRIVLSRTSLPSEIQHVMCIPMSRATQRREPKSGYFDFRAISTSHARYI